MMETSCVRTGSTNNVISPITVNNVPNTTTPAARARRPPRRAWTMRTGGANTMAKKPAMATHDSTRSVARMTTMRR